MGWHEVRLVKILFEAIDVVAARAMLRVGAVHHRLAARPESESVRIARVPLQPRRDLDAGDFLRTFRLDVHKLDRRGQLGKR